MSRSNIAHLSRNALACAFVLVILGSSVLLAQEKQMVTTAADLPRFSYPLTQPPSVLLVTDDATFGDFAAKVDADVQLILNHYTISDHETLRRLLLLREIVQELQGDLQGALATSNQIRDLEDKSDAKLTSGMLERAMAAAQTDTRRNKGPEFEHALQKRYTEEVNALPWATVEETIKEEKTGLTIVSPTLIIGSARAKLDPQVAKSGTLDLEGAERLIHDRWGIKIYIPLKDQLLAAVTPYIAAHKAPKLDIWEARDVTFPSEDGLTPVRIAIFDSGVDTALYPKQLYVDPHPGSHSPHGLAFDTQGKLYDADLQPLTPEQEATYPKVLALDQGSDDLHNGIDSPEADHARKMMSSMPPDKLASFLKQDRFLGQWMHGTHVAGIAVRGNPAARLVVIQFNDGLEYLPFTPTVAWAEKFKADFHDVGVYLRDHDVRVVNMSWADSQGEIEQWLTNTSADTDPIARKLLAGKIYAIWRDAVLGAIQVAPDTVWVCAAGNSNSNASFLGDVPASLHLPNLVTVGAVDQAGGETSFTSYGDTVILDANGYQVESFVPGGTRLRESGTSMASPNVANLAAKLIALNPKLTPKQTIQLMKQGATTSADGRLHIINPKQSVALEKELPQ
jgi:hypothetical protein